jgi:hypothetical protein
MAGCRRLRFFYKDPDGDSLCDVKDILIVYSFGRRFINAAVQVNEVDVVKCVEKPFAHPAVGDAVEIRPLQENNCPFGVEASFFLQPTRLRWNSTTR